MLRLHLFIRNASYLPGRREITIVRSYQCINEPRLLSKRVPDATPNAKNDPRMPRIDVSDISVLYRGDTRDAEPPPNPANRNFVTVVFQHT